jgi:hypothetical protein
MLIQRSSRGLWLCFMLSILPASAALAGNIISFDPDGAGSLPAVAVASFDYLPGNTLLWQSGESNTYGVLVQTRLGALLDSDGNVIPTPGLNATGPGGFEITLAAAFEVNIDFVNGGNYTIATASLTGVENYIRLYYDDTPDANDLSGLGFLDGLTIGDFGVQSFNAVFSLLSLFAPQPIDQFGPNNYPAANVSAMAFGGGQLTAYTGYVNASFFLDGTDLQTMQVNSNVASPFTQANPSAEFLNETGVPGDGVPGWAADPTAQDKLQLQNDATGSFITGGGVPEPATLALLAVGSVLLAPRRRRGSRG